MKCCDQMKQLVFNKDFLLFSVADAIGFTGSESDKRTEARFDLDCFYHFYSTFPYNC